ncbi:MAG: hypothetical protein K8R53_09365, partial [Bacteroidales bacterium]|nr:hypothetical protein [Bacteroidales bacterium]
MKNLKHILIVFGISLLLILSGKNSVQSQTSTKVSGGEGYFIGGYSLHNLSSLNDRLSTFGQPELNEGTISLGGGGHFILNNFMLGGEGHGLIGGNNSNADFLTSYGGGYGFFNIGYVLFHTKNAIIYPMLGIGGGGLTLSITDRKKQPVNFDDLLADPARESYLSTNNFLLNFSLSSDFFTMS